jgi:hypothetical protein
VGVFSSPDVELKTFFPEIKEAQKVEYFTELAGRTAGKNFG